MPKLYRPAKRTMQRTPTSSQDWYHTKAWRKVRAQKLLVDPVCEVHESVGILIDCTRKAPIDHIIRIGDGGATTDERNLMTLCTTCHERKSSMESRGFMIDWDINEYGERIPKPSGRQLVITILAKSI
jgi:5-methylcytosine-specific restriction enzyme A